MQLYFPAALAAAFIALTAPLTFAQSLSDLPACAQEAGLSGIDATGCSVTDIKCICDAVPFINTLRAYIEAQCDASDQAEALMFAQKLCGTVGVVISATVSGLSMSSTTTTMMPPTSAPVSVEVVTSLSGTATSTIFSTPEISTASTTSTSLMASGSTTKTTSAPVSSFTGGAGRLGHEVLAAVLAAGALVVVV